MLRACWFLLTFVPFTLFISASALLSTYLDGSGRLYHRHARAWSRVCCLLAGIRVDVEGAGNIPAAGPVIFMSNHQGYFDIPALFLAIPRAFAYVAKEELFRIPVFGQSMAAAGYVPLDRGAGRKALKSVDRAADLISGGKSVVIFPEGTRSEDQRLLPFKRGAFLLARKAQVPIVPVTINGSMRVNPKGMFRINPGRIGVRFAPPIPVTGESGIEALTAEVGRQIEEGLET